MSGPIPAARDNVLVLKRETRSGRVLHYRLEVIQQPERARACGSGPKCKTLFCRLTLVVTPRMQSR
jgi:hypothetical protein